MNAPRRIAIVVHPQRDVRRAVAELRAWGEEHGAEVGEPADGAALVVALGGDGTVLAALRAAAPGRLPVLGVACGSLGALTTVAADELSAALDAFAAGEWAAHRMPALAVGADGEAATAINDLVVVRAGGGQIGVDVTVDGALYGRFAGDGVIVSTQVGSSAYALAAGGPVLAPGCDAWLITPLAPHGGCLPPVVLGAGSRARLAVQPGHGGARVEVDGQPSELPAATFDIELRTDAATLVRVGGEEEFLTGLRRRGILADSPRILARDARATGGEPPPPVPGSHSPRRSG